MKIKEFGPHEGAHPWGPLRSSTVIDLRISISPGVSKDPNILRNTTGFKPIRNLYEALKMYINGYFARDIGISGRLKKKDLDI